jgi:predicted nucleic acid-binding protein
MTEKGSLWLQALAANRNNLIVIAQITWVEVMGALMRYQREGKSTPDIVRRAVQSFSHDLDSEYQTVELDRPLCEAAMRLIQKHPLRAYDAVQLASASKVRDDTPKVPPTSFTFVSADTRLIKIALTIGIKVENPENYP